MAGSGSGDGGELTVQTRGAGRVQQRRPRHDGFTAARRDAFIDALKLTCNVAEAARSVGLSTNSAYALKGRDKGFAALWMAALDQGYMELETFLVRQVMQGTERTETVRAGGGKRGKVVSTKTVHSYPLGVGLRLLDAHRKAVMEHRIALAQAQARETPDDPAVVARVQAAMADVRRRLGVGVAGAGGFAGGVGMNAGVVGGDVPVLLRRPSAAKDGRVGGAAVPA